MNKFSIFNLKIEYVIKSMINFSDFKKLFCITCYFKVGDIVIEVHNFSELRNLANDAKIRSSLKFLLIQFTQTIKI